MYNLLQSIIKAQWVNQRFVIKVMLLLYTKALRAAMPLTTVVDGKIKAWPLWAKVAVSTGATGGKHGHSRRMQTRSKCSDRSTVKNIWQRKKAVAQTAQSKNWLALWRKLDSTLLFSKPIRQAPCRKHFTIQWQWRSIKTLKYPVLLRSILVRACSWCYCCRQRLSSIKLLRFVNMRNK